MRPTEIRKKAEDLVDQVIEDSKSGLLNVEYRNYVKEFRRGVLLISNSNRSMFFKPEWVNGNEIVDEFAATKKICNYIKDNWNLDVKYRYTVEKMDTRLTCYEYKAEFSVPTKQYPIPQVTVSAFFTVEIPHLQLLPVYVKYRLETDSRVYVVGKHTFNKNRFEHLFVIKRDVLAGINRYSGWSSSGPGYGPNS